MGSCDVLQPQEAVTRDDLGEEVMQRVQQTGFSFEEKTALAGQPIFSSEIRNALQD